jgi:hypothetical protein
MAIPGNVGGKKSTFSSPAAMAQAQRSAESQSMKALQDRREQTRQDFFKGRPDISPNRLDRRQIQADLYEKYKQDLVRQGKYVTDSQGKPVKTASGDYVYTGTATFDTDSSSPTFGRYVTYGVNDKMQDLSRQYGPTFKEIGSDIGYGLGSIGKGIGDFIGRGGVLGSVASDLFQRIKSGTQQGIETVGGLYDNLRSAFSGQPTVNYGGGSTITTTTNQPAIDLTPASIETEILPSMDLNRNIGDESDPSIFGIENPLFNQQVYDPIRVSDMDITGLTAQNLIDPTRVGQTVSDYYDASLLGVDINTPIGKLNLNPMAQKVFLDGKMGNINYGGSFDPNTSDYNVGIGTQLPYGVGLSVGNSSNDIPGMSFNKYIGPVNTSLNLSEQGGSLGLNTIVDPLRAVYPNSAIGVPINVSASVDSTGRITPNIGLAVPFKKGGSVDKYAGLGYKLK